MNIAKPIIEFILRTVAMPLRSSIKYKLFMTFFLTISIPVLVLGIFSYEQSAANVENDYIVFKSQLIEQASSMLDDDIRTLIQQTMMLYNHRLDDYNTVINTNSEQIDQSYMDAYSMVDRYFSSVLQTNSKLDGITLMSMDGQIKYHVDRQYGDFNLRNFALDDWFSQTKELKGMPLLRGPHPNELVNSKHVGGVPVLSISRTLIDLFAFRTEPFGILIMDQKVDKMQTSMLKLARTDATEQLFVINPENQILFNSDQSGMEPPIELLSVITDERQGSQRQKYNGEMHLITHYQSPETHWRVISLLPVSVLKEKSQFLKNIMISLLIILFVLIFILSALVSLFISRPLKRLSQYFKAFQRGNFDTQIAVKGNDELSQIGQTFNTMVVNIRMLINEKYTMKLLHQQSELKALQNQINPHFLYNTLTSIKEVIHKGEQQHAETMVQHLSDLFRYNLSKSEPKVNLHEELNYIRKYINIQESRFPGKFHVYYDVDDAALEGSILRLTLQPIVENALLHGLYQLRGRRGEVHIIAKLFHDALYIYVQDNGVGIDEGKLELMNSRLQRDPATLSEEEWDSLGITNVNARIKYYFGEEYGLRITSRLSEGTTVKIILPAPDYSFRYSPGENPVTFLNTR